MPQEVLRSERFVATVLDDGFAEIRSLTTGEAFLLHPKDVDMIRGVQALACGY